VVKLEKVQKGAGIHAEVAVEAPKGKEKKAAAPEDRREDGPKTRAIEQPKVDHGAWQIEGSAVAARTAEFKKPIAERLEDLLQAADAAYKYFWDAGGYAGGSEWNQALDALQGAGIEPRMRVGPEWKDSLEGDEAKLQRYEWFLGQLLAAAIAVGEDERPPSYFDRVQDLGKNLKDLPGGTDLIARIAKHDAANEAKLKGFAKEQRDLGRIELGGKDGAYQDLFGNGLWDIHKLVGRQMAVMIEDREYELHRIEGELLPHQLGKGNAEWSISGTEINTNHVRALFVQDRSTITPKQLEAAAKKRHDLDAATHQKLFGSWWNAHDLDGRRGSFLLADKEKGEWVVVEGKIRPDPKAGGNAPFFVELEKGELRALNINDVKSYYVEDTSPIRPAELEARMKKEKMIDRSSKAWGEELGGYWPEEKKLLGRTAVALFLDSKAHQFRVVEGKITGHPAGYAIMDLETSAGPAKINLNEVDRFWVSRAE
jgi:hypothetical protein